MIVLLLLSELKVLELRLCRELLSARGGLIWVLLIKVLFLVALRRPLSTEVYCILSDRILHRLELFELLRRNLLIIVWLNTCKSWFVLFLMTVRLLKILEERVHIAHHIVQFIVNLLEIYTKWVCLLLTVVELWHRMVVVRRRKHSILLHTHLWNKVF